MKTITLDWLVERNACGEAIDAFTERFGEKASVRDVVEALHERELYNWEAWLLGQSYGLTILMIKEGADIHTANDLALFWAVREGQLRIVQFLLEDGANVHRDNEDVLQEALYGGYLRIAQYLLEHGANVNAIKRVDLNHALRGGHSRTVRFFRGRLQAA